MCTGAGGKGGYDAFKAGSKREDTEPVTEKAVKGWY